MSDGFAYDAAAGWTITETGQIARAASIVDKARRLLRPLFGPVRGETWRGNVAWPRGVDSLDVIIADRIRYLLTPMLTAGELSSVEIEVVDHPTQPKRKAAALILYDTNKKPHRLTEPVRIP